MVLVSHSVENIRILPWISFTLNQFWKGNSKKLEKFAKIKFWVSNKVELFELHKKWNLISRKNDLYFLHCDLLKPLFTSKLKENRWKRAFNFITYYNVYFMDFATKNLHITVLPTFLKYSHLQKLCEIQSTLDPV